MEAAFLFAIVVTWLASAIFCFWLAEIKGRDGVWWLIWGAIFGIAALIALAGAPPVAKRLERQCHSCDEAISVKALVCHWCGARQYNPQLSSANTEDQTTDESRSEFMLTAVGIGIVAFIIIISIIVSVATRD